LKAYEVVWLAIIIASALGTMAFGALLAVALGRVAALADENADRLLAEHDSERSIAPGTLRYAGFARAQSMIARESSIAVPSSRTRVGTHRLPVSAWTSRRPGVWLKTPGSSPKP
jgi:hypothetical protein